MEVPREDNMETLCPELTKPAFTTFLSCTDVLIEIATFLGDHEDIINMSLVCSAFAQASRHPRFWISIDLTFENLHASTRPCRFISNLLVAFHDSFDSKSKTFDKKLTTWIEKHIPDWKLMDQFGYRILPNEGILCILNSSIAVSCLEKLHELGYPLKVLLFWSPDPLYSEHHGGIMPFDIFDFAIRMDRLDILQWIQDSKVFHPSDVLSKSTDQNFNSRQTGTPFLSRIFDALRLHKWDVCSFLMEHFPSMQKVEPISSWSYIEWESGVTKFPQLICDDEEVRNWVVKFPELLHSYMNYSFPALTKPIWSEENGFDSQKFNRYHHYRCDPMENHDLMNRDFIALDDKFIESTRFDMEYEGFVLPLRENCTLIESTDDSLTDDPFLVDSENDSDEEAPNFTLQNICFWTQDDIEAKIREFEEIATLITTDGNIRIHKRKHVDDVEGDDPILKKRMPNVKRSDLVLDKYLWDDLVQEVLDAQSGSSNPMAMTPTAKMILQNAMEELIPTTIQCRISSQWWGLLGMHRGVLREKDDYRCPDDDITDLDYVEDNVDDPSSSCSEDEADDKDEGDFTDSEGSAEIDSEFELDSEVESEVDDLDEFDPVEMQEKDEIQEGIEIKEEIKISSKKSKKPSCGVDKFGEIILDRLAQFNDDEEEYFFKENYKFWRVEQ
jgi:hypothetical protein